MLRLFLVMLDQISVMESLGMECTRCWCRILKGWEDRRAVWNVSVFVRKRWQGGCWWARARDCTPSRPSSVVAPPTHVVRQALVTWLWGSAYCSYESLHHRTTAGQEGGGNTASLTEDGMERARMQEEQSRGDGDETHVRQEWQSGKAR